MTAAKPMNGTLSKLMFMIVSVLVSALGALLMIVYSSVTKDLDAVRAQHEQIYRAEQQILLAQTQAGVELAELRKEFDDVKAHGSPITDKRLTIIERKLKIGPAE